VTDERVGPSPQQASDTLETIAAVQVVALDRGQYSRGFATLISLWAGLLAIAVGLEAPWMLAVLFAGVFALVFARRRLGAWVQEVPTRGGVWVVLPLGLLFGAVFILGNVARQDLGIAGAPYVAGSTIAVGLYSLMEWARRSRLAAGTPSGRPAS